MTITPNLRFDHYEILSPLGAGGMGGVYCARDPRMAASSFTVVMIRKRDGIHRRDELDGGGEEVRICANEREDT
jgi:hypothetical protein